MQDKIPVFPLFFFPNIYYFACLKQYKEVIIEQNETFLKQSFRNRTQIMSSNNIDSVIVPLERNSGVSYRNVTISASENWHIKAFRKLQSCYGKAAYFPFYEDKLKTFFSKDNSSLFELNLNILKFFIKEFEIETSLTLSEQYITATQNITDYRQMWRKERKINEKDYLFKPYFQCFCDKLGFVSNLSCIDLLLNMGRESYLYI